LVTRVGLRDAQPNHMHTHADRHFVELKLLLDFYSDLERKRDGYGELQ
jgi:hypothetical protein